MKKTKIVATMSDFRCTEEFVKNLFDAGMDVVRVNSAHVSEEGATHIVETVHRVNPAIPIMIDTKGPEIRVTTIADEYGNSINFRPGDRVAVRGSDGSDKTTRKVVYMNVPNIVDDIPVGARMLIADGELEIRVVEKTAEELICEFVVGGAMRSRKSVNVPSVSINLPSVTEKDRRFIEWAVKNDVDFIAHSFVRSARDIKAVQDILDAHGSKIKIISKIENQEGIDNIDEIVEIMKTSPSIPEAKATLCERFGLSDEQAQAIVDMTLGKLTGLERQKTEDELNRLLALISDLEDILANEWRIKEIIKNDLLEIKRKYADERRTEIVASANEIVYEDLIERHTCVITLTKDGYIKRLPSDIYSAQKRGGKGVIGMATKEEDVVDQVVAVNSHSFLLMFTNTGKVHVKKAYLIPESSRTAKGTAAVNVIDIEKGEKITALISLDDFEGDGCLTMVTNNGIVKRTAISEFAYQRKGGKRAITLDEGDELIYVRSTGQEDELLIATGEGNAVRFPISSVTPTGRNSRGVIGIRPGEGDHVAGVCVVDESKKLLTVTEKGFGKRCEFSDFAAHNRGGKGMRCQAVSDRTGRLAAIAAVSETDDILIITDQGTVIRTRVEEIPVYSRSASGVIVMRPEEGSVVSNFTVVEKEEEDTEAVAVTDEAVVSGNPVNPGDGTAE